MKKQGKKKVSSKDNFQQKVLFVNRCSKVLKGGRKFSFSALVLVADNNGAVGYGFDKANELTDAIKKAEEKGKKSLVTFNKNETTIPHEVVFEHDGAKVMLKPAKEGTGIIAGSVVRSILQFAGIENVVTKSLGSNNPMNLTIATFKALESLEKIEDIKKRREV